MKFKGIERKISKYQKYILAKDSRESKKYIISDAQIRKMVAGLHLPQEHSKDWR